jgi:hypothetical protein
MMANPSSPPPLVRQALTVAELRRHPLPRRTPDEVDHLRKLFRVIKGGRRARQT